ncbi:MAG: hypothetical protein EPN88_13905 [Bacteroidetes bacterium]|nr:MAG: hypothetical protein EPN88_13905 [Bacteroidota bacterium]
MNFKYLTDNSWVSRKFNNGDFDYYLVIGLIDMFEAIGNETIKKYHVRVCAISITEAGEKNLENSFNCCGYPELMKHTNDTQKISALYEYGIFAQLWSKEGNNSRQLIKEAHVEAKLITSFLFGFRMDKAMNKIGSDGWDFIKGDITAGLRR